MNLLCDLFPPGLCRVSVSVLVEMKLNDHIVSEFTLQDGTVLAGVKKFFQVFGIIFLIFS